VKRQPLYRREKVGCISSVKVRFWLGKSAVVQFLVVAVYCHFEFPQKTSTQRLCKSINILNVPQKPLLKDFVNV
jgi:hypothetical protein